MGIYSAFADLLDYPGDNLLALVDNCRAATAGNAAADSARPCAGAAPATHLAAFREEAERLGRQRLEEAYTAAFDLDPTCSLYVGHHVFGENARRSYFMVRLAGLYREAGLPQCDRELPDYLPVVLRYLDTTVTSPPADDLLRDAVAPAVVELTERLDALRHPYAPALHALLAHVSSSVGEASREGAPA